MVAASVTSYLGEVLVQVGLIFGPDPYAGIMHAELCAAFSVMPFALQYNAHFAVLGEFDSIAGKIE